MRKWTWNGTAVALLAILAAAPVEAAAPVVSFALRLGDRVETIPATRDAPRRAAALLGRPAPEAGRLFEALVQDGLGTALAHTLAAGGLAQSRPGWRFLFVIDPDDDSGRPAVAEVLDGEQLSRALLPARSIPPQEVAETLLRMAARMSDPAACDAPQELTSDFREVLTPHLAFRAGWEDYLVARLQALGPRSRAVLAASGPRTMVVDHVTLGRMEVPFDEVSPSDRTCNEIVVARTLLRLERELPGGFDGVRDAFARSGEGGCRSLEDLLAAYRELHPGQADELARVLAAELGTLSLGARAGALGEAALLGI